MGATFQGFLITVVVQIVALHLTSAANVTNSSKLGILEDNVQQTKAELQSNALATNHGVDKRSAMFSPMLHEGEADKRAMGFQGVRGKKDELLNDEIIKENEIHEPQNYITDSDEMEKRAMGFQGVRGKKDSYLLDDYEKRASMGFHGMRGKKDFYDDKRAMAGFHGMRGKKDDIDDSYYKRAMGFHGMRGKKDYSDEPSDLYDLDDSYLLSSGLYSDEDLEKRASMGFHGMRGKKDDEDMTLDKRASMGFHGMRGKKESDLGYKRAMGFLGMRGKKAQSGFFGMRGKKDSAIDEINDLNELLEYLKSSDKSLERTRRGTLWLRNSKKAKASFFGVRGKKSGVPDFSSAYE